MMIFSAAIGALLVMTLLSALLGQVLPQLISKQHTEIASAVLFLIFGIKLGSEAYKMSGYEHLEELEEVTAEIGDSGKKLEEGSQSQASKEYFHIPGISPIWIQTFVMTFLAEWGDRSQIASKGLLN
jgi:putative Ca2+/H+ antiporter (TMEM165/GDT1 family)